MLFKVTLHVGQAIGGNVDLKVGDMSGNGNIEIVAQKIVNNNFCKLPCSCEEVNLCIVVANLCVETLCHDWTDYTL